LGGSLSGGGLHGFIVPEHALACLYTTSIVSTTGVAELVPTPAQGMFSTKITSSTCVYEWIIFITCILIAMAICEMMTTQNTLFTTSKQHCARILIWSIQTEYYCRENTIMVLYSNQVEDLLLLISCNHCSTVLGNRNYWWVETNCTVWTEYKHFHASNHAFDGDVRIQRTNNITTGYWISLVVDLDKKTAHFYA
jgi:hypothetical protein